MKSATKVILADPNYVCIMQKQNIKLSNYTQNCDYKTTYCKDRHRFTQHTQATQNNNQKCDVDIT